MEFPRDSLYSLDIFISSHVLWNVATICYFESWTLVMEAMLSFSADITKTLSAKRKRIQCFTNASLKTSNRKFDEIWKSQQNDR